VKFGFIAKHRGIWPTGWLWRRSVAKTTFYFSMRKSRTENRAGNRAENRGATVAHPRVPGATERVQRVVNTLDERAWLRNNFVRPASIKSQ
jgi:hypothetical protein